MLSELQFLSPTPALRELLLLLTLEEDPSISQKGIARKIGLGPSMVNNYIKSLACDGRLEVRGKNHKTTTYRLTPHGRARKDQLLGQYMHDTIRLYKHAKLRFRPRLERFRQAGVSTVVLFGASDTAEVVLHTAQELGFEIVGVVDSDPGKQGREFAGRPIVGPEQIGTLRPHGVVITSLGYREEIRRSLEPLRAEGLRICTL